MDERVGIELRSLEEAVSKVMDHGKILAPMVEGHGEAVEYLRQLAVALHYEIETLKARLTHEMIESKFVS